MKRDDVIRILKDHHGELAERFGVKTLALFGSLAREETTKGSDVDLLVEFDDRPITLFHLARAQQRLEELLSVEKVDLVMRDSIFPALKKKILAEAVDVV